MWTNVQTPITLETGQTRTHPRDVVTLGAVVAVAIVRAIRSPLSEWTPIPADRSRPSIRARTFPRLRMTVTAVLATALGFALSSVLPQRTSIFAQWSRPSRMADALSGNVVAPTVLASAFLLAVQPVHTFRATRLAHVPHVPSGAATLAVVGIAGGAVLTFALVLAVWPVKTIRTRDVAFRSSVTALALAGFGRHADTVQAILAADWDASSFRLVLRVTLAAVIHESVLVQDLRFVHRLVLYLVLGASRWNAQTPHVMSRLHGLLLRYQHRHRIRFFPRAYVRSFEHRFRRAQQSKQNDCKQRNNDHPWIFL